MNTFVCDSGTCRRSNEASQESNKTSYHGRLRQRCQYVWEPVNKLSLLHYVSRANWEIKLEIYAQLRVSSAGWPANFPSKNWWRKSTDQKFMDSRSTKREFLTYQKSDCTTEQSKPSWNEDSLKKLSAHQVSVCCCEWVEMGRDAAGMPNKQRWHGTAIINLTVCNQ